MNHRQSRYFADVDAHGEDTIWENTDRGPRAKLRRSDLPVSAQDLWFPIVDALTHPPTTGRVIPSRSTDPDTSRGAEPVGVRANTQRHRMLEGFYWFGEKGATDEQAADVQNVLHTEYAKRSSELRQAGLLVVVEGETRKGMAGHPRMVSRITEEGLRVLRGLGL